MDIGDIVTFTEYGKTNSNKITPLDIRGVIESFAGDICYIIVIDENNNHWRTVKSIYDITIINQSEVE